MLSIQCYTWISELGDPSIVICIVIVNAIYRSSHRRFFIKMLFLQIYQNSQENTCTRVSSLRDSITLNFSKFVGPLYLQNTFGRLLLHLEPCQISMMELFSGNSKSLTVFEIKNPSYMFKRVLITHCLLYHFMEIFFMHCK